MGHAEGKVSSAFWLRPGPGEYATHPVVAKRSSNKDDFLRRNFIRDLPDDLALVQLVGAKSQALMLDRTSHAVGRWCFDVASRGTVRRLLTLSSNDNMPLAEQERCSCKAL